MKICKLTLIALVPAFGFVAAMPTPYHIPPQNSGHSLLDNYLSKQKEAPAGQSAVKSENDKFLERWATDFGAPAPAVAPSTNPGTFTKALTSAADALFGLLGKGKADKGKNPQPIHNVDDADKPTSSRAAEKAPEKQHTINPENKIVNWRVDPPHKYTPSFDSDDEEEAGPSGFAPSWAEQYMPDGKPDEVIPSSYQDNFIASSEIEASGVTAEELAEELWGKAIVGSIPVQSHEEYWYLPKKRSGWARFLEWCRDAWEKVVGVFKKKKKDA